jgi:hypothetical protein
MVCAFRRGKQEINPADAPTKLFKIDPLNSPSHHMGGAEILLVGRGCKGTHVDAANHGHAGRTRPGTCPPGTTKNVQPPEQDANPDNDLGKTTRSFGESQAVRTNSMIGISAFPLSRASLAEIAI